MMYNNSRYHLSICQTKHPDRVVLKAGPLRLKEPTNKIKIRILSETSILYLICHVSVILTVDLQANIVGRKIVVHYGVEPATS